MYREKYGELVKFVASTFDIKALEALDEPCNFTISDVAYTLVYEVKILEDCVIVYCDFGNLPEERALEVTSRLLETNILLSTRNAAHFVMNPETEHVLLKAHISLEKFSPEEIYATLIEYGLMANLWRKTYFLDEGMIDEPIQTLPSLMPNAA